ncbi:MAG: hypothetical protein GX638_03745 [Crenarchaeota archaeon]|nr:hypothetical protein [Thermoproteota archaeon]
MDKAEYKDKFNKEITERQLPTTCIKHLAVSGLSNVSARIKSSCNLTGNRPQSATFHTARHPPTPFFRNEKTVFRLLSLFLIFN